MDKVDRQYLLWTHTYVYLIEIRLVFFGMKHANEGYEVLIMLSFHVTYAQKCYWRSQNICQVSYFWYQNNSRVDLTYFPLLFSSVLFKKTKALS
jgi:hypothetical protein